MTRLSERYSPMLMGVVAVCAVLFTSAFAGVRFTAAAQNRKPWVAPDSAKDVKNPVPATPGNLQAGAKLFADNCVNCHGDKGKGDGFGAGMSDVPPANFTDAKLMSSETDGTLFWKMSEGRDPMPAWKDTLSETQRWELVNFIRKLDKDANPDVGGPKGVEK